MQRNQSQDDLASGRKNSYDDSFTVNKRKPKKILTKDDMNGVPGADYS